MNRTESEAFLRVLSSVARADGSVDEDEEDVLRALSPGESAGEIAERPDLDDALSRLRSPESRRATLEAALAIASIDGKCTQGEHAVLERIRRAFGMNELPLVEAEAKWLERLREPRERMAKATDDFLHAVRSAKEGLSDKEYEALIAELRDERARVLAAALP